MSNKLPSSVYVIKMGYWCDVRGIYNYDLEMKANNLAGYLSQLPCVNSAAWGEWQRSVFEIELKIPLAGLALEDIVYYDKRFRKIITDSGMKIEE